MALLQRTGAGAAALARRCQMAATSASGRITEVDEVLRVLIQQAIVVQVQGTVIGGQVLADYGFQGG